ncbi:MAG: S-layer homology domain-containing protein [Candidatus Microthrix sp.]|uniref:S-layer homology domain-containing protein n=1 Tax=Candidatus Neomicrothrix subdominans TaxID=2954438 RepID=A0A936TD88_9ACTN|nr:S-layer homology domain-containing protein [Candidatus Microthrix subdominans]
MKIGRSRIWVSMALLLGIATMELGVPAGAAPGAPAALQGVGNASCFSPAPHGFSDVPTTSFANTAIAWLVEAGITTGTTPTTFTPQANTSRAQMAVFLHRNAGEPAPAGQQNFTDVPTTSFANTAISWLVEAGITTGTTPTTFSPQANTTRADMAVFLWRNAGAPAPAGQQHFTDVPTTSYANTAIAWLVEAGITTGTTPTTFSPQANVTRAEMAVFLWRYNCPDPNLGNVTTLAGNGTRGFADGPGNTAQFNNPYGVAFAPNGNIYVADTLNQRIRVTNPTTGQVTTLAGTGTEGFADGPGNTAQFNYPTGVAVAPNGTVYVADQGNHRIRAINPTTGQVTTLAGSTAGFADGPGNTAQFNFPTGVAVAPNGTVYVADQENQRIRAINPTTGQVTTLAGTGTPGFADGPGNTAQFNDPTGVAVAPNGTVYVADHDNHRIRAINPTTGQVTTLAGSTAGFADGPGNTAQFLYPQGVAVAPNGTVYVGDTGNNRIRAINPTTGRVTTLAGSNRRVC